MRDPKRDRLIHWIIRLWLRLPFRKRFSQEEYLELFRLERQETRAMLRRPQVLLGSLVLGGLVIYWVFTGLARSPTDWSAAGLGFLILFGWVCVLDGTRGYLSERLLRLKQHPEDVHDI